MRASIQNQDCFSPWAETSFNLASFDPKSRYANKTLTTTQPSTRHNSRHTSSNNISKLKPSIVRQCLSVHKVNLNEPLSKQLVQSNSKPYSGPRLTFYSSMNPAMTPPKKLTRPASAVLPSQHNKPPTQALVSPIASMRQFLQKYDSLLSKTPKVEKKAVKTSVYFCGDPSVIEKPNNRNMMKRLRRLQMARQNRKLKL